MDSNLDRLRARARLLLAADNWRELCQFLEKDVPMLIAEIEQLQRELADAKRLERRTSVRLSETSPVPVKGAGESRLMTIKEFAQTIGVTESTVRDWRLRRKINVVKVGRLIRIPRTEVQRLIVEGTIPKRPSRKL